ncbi:endolytic transglycosylase MltG [Kitasatospora sp. NBC_01287]|uniref:endolytic transglycosylase MltG n=1 Tax=Kitasatospora sp. NBC_01287 TaxID=2903573 RepID=UPI0022533206|nr:endolytic transglycosylase MltG [Kitasatospora sp. NBC_01287]MCX4745109.1 endolytic transglycosylase MltG [Kitasatospora sp. NBC_01287]
MTDLGRGYGSQPWHDAEPGYGEQQAAVPGEQEYPPQEPYGQGHQYPVQGQDQYGQQQAYVPMDPYAQQQQWQQDQQLQQQPQQQVYQPYPQQQGGYPQQQGGYVGQQGYPQQGGYPQQQIPQQMPQQMPLQQAPQQSFPQQMQPQQQMPQQLQPQQPFPQQQVPPMHQQPHLAPQQMQPQQPQIPHQQAPHQQFPQQQIPHQQVAQPAQPAPAAPRPSGPGPDGIDWEAEAAALEAGDRPAAEQYAEDGDFHEGDFHEGDYAEEGEFTEDGEHAEGEAFHEDGDGTAGDYAEGEEEYDSFLGGEDDSQEAQADRKAKGKKSGLRNSGACLVVALVLLGGLGGAGYWGYGAYKHAIAPPADFQGNGTGKVQVQILDGSSAGDMAVVLKNADVVKSTGAFNNAYAKAGKPIQPGYYDMQKEMSGDAAVALMISEAGGDSLIIPEGKKASDIYAMIDTKLKLAAGTAAAAAKANAANLGLPSYANGNPEGFLWPTKYSVAQGMKPEDLLKQMVSNALTEYSQLNLDSAAPTIGLKNAYDVITEASILQAEGNNVADFGKMARVISNRLNGPLTKDLTKHVLGMDTTLQYSVGSKTLTSAQINDASNKYNTFINPGLPPTPISNPGEAAIQAVLNPTPGGWIFFIAMSPTETRFSSTKDEHSQNVKEYCTDHGQGFDAEHLTCK